MKRDAWATKTEDGEKDLQTFTHDRIKVNLIDITYSCTLSTHGVLLGKYNDQIKKLICFRYQVNEIHNLGGTQNQQISWSKI